MSELAAFFEVEKRIYQSEYHWAVRMRKRIRWMVEEEGISELLARHYAGLQEAVGQDVSALLVGFGPGPQEPIHIMTWPSNFASPDADTTHDTNKTVYLQELHESGRYNDAL